MRRAHHLSPLWLALLAAPLFIQQAMAAPEVYLHVDGKPVAEALTLDKGTDTLTHRLDKGSHQIRISDAGNSCGTSFGPTEAKPLPFGTAQPMDSSCDAPHSTKRACANAVSISSSEGRDSAPRRYTITFLNTRILATKKCPAGWAGRLS